MEINDEINRPGRSGESKSAPHPQSMCSLHWSLWDEASMCVKRVGEECSRQKGQHMLPILGRFWNAGGEWQQELVRGEQERQAGVRTHRALRTRPGCYP